MFREEWVARQRHLRATRQLEAVNDLRMDHDSRVNNSPTNRFTVILLVPQTKSRLPSPLAARIIFGGTKNGSINASCQMEQERNRGFGPLDAEHRRTGSICESPGGGYLRRNGWVGGMN